MGTIAKVKLEHYFFKNSKYMYINKQTCTVYITSFNYMYSHYFDRQQKTCASASIFKSILFHKYVNNQKEHGVGWGGWVGRGGGGLFTDHHH